MPLWISHRGFKDVCDENTLEAFRAAVGMGFEALETDIRLTKDSHLVLMHDPTLFRVAGDFRAIRELGRAELKSVRLLNGGHPLFLDEFTEEFGNLFWTFDVKPEYAWDTIEALAAWMRRAGGMSDLLVRSRFVTWRRRHEALLRRSLGTEARFYAREREAWRAGLAVLAGIPALSGIRAERTYPLKARAGGRMVFREKVVREFQNRGARTLAFLPENDAEARAAIEAGFDEILTDGRIVGK